MILYLQSLRGKELRQVQEQRQEKTRFVIALVVLAVLTAVIVPVSLYASGVIGSKEPAANDPMPLSSTIIEGKLGGFAWWKAAVVVWLGAESYVLMNPKSVTQDNMSLLKLMTPLQGIYRWKTDYYSKAGWEAGFTFSVGERREGK